MKQVVGLIWPVGYSLLHFLWRIIKFKLQSVRKSRWDIVSNLKRSYNLSEDTTIIPETPLKWNPSTKRALTLSPKAESLVFVEIQTGDWKPRLISTDIVKHVYEQIWGTGKLTCPVANSKVPTIQKG